MDDQVLQLPQELRTVTQTLSDCVNSNARHIEDCHQKHSVVRVATSIQIRGKGFRGRLSIVLVLVNFKSMGSWEIP